MARATNIHNKVAPTAANKPIPVRNSTLLVKNPTAFSPPAKNAINTNMGDRNAITTLKVTEGPPTTPILP
jgi:hypothetical protein